jgi:tRNA A37 methylthiotransferase MiaB
MGRGYTLKDFIHIVRSFKKAFPKISIMSDLIVGLPTETEQDFKKSLKVVKEFDAVNVSKFGAHPATPAACMKKVKPSVTKERCRKLVKQVKLATLKRNEQWIGWAGECLVDEVGTKKGTFVARNFAYKPIVIHARENLVGKWVKVEVVDCTSSYLLGKVRI